MDQIEYTPECVENALMAAEVAGGRNSAVLAAEFRRIRDELAERDDQLHSAHREIVRQRIEIKRLTAPTPGRIICGGCATVAAQERELAVLRERVGSQDRALRELHRRIGDTSAATAALEMPDRKDAAR